MTGRIESWRADRGFGFARAPTGECVFVHVTDVAGANQFNLPQVGDVVEFEMLALARGPRAVEVRILRRAEEEDKR